MLAPRLLTTGPSLTAVTPMTNGCAGTVMAPSDTVKRKPADAPSDPSCTNVTRPAARSACVKDVAFTPFTCT